MRNSKMVQYYFLGRGAISNLPDLLNNKKAGATDAFVVMVIDHYFENKNILDLSYLSDQDLIIYAQTDDEPKTSYVDQLVDLARAKGRLPVAIVGIGGGSAMDIAKAISVLLTNPGPSENYQGWDLVKNPAIYKIGIPTIAGTGAEFTRTAVLTGPTKKLGINSDQSVFDQIILDANLLTTVPKDQFLYTAMDCYVHNAESLLGRINDSMTIALAEKSTKMIEEIFLGEMDLEKLLVASGMGGLAVANSAVGICHPLSYGLSIELGLRHGYAICIAFNQLEEYYPQVKTFKEILKKYEIVLPKIITDDITDEQLDRMAEATLKNENPLSNAFGPDWKTIFSKEKVIALLKKCKNMPGYELIGKEEQDQLMDIFNTSNGVLFPHGFDALRNNRYRVREFEKKFAEKTGSKYAQAVTSGTVAQVVAMLAMGVKPGDEVITQAFTFVATVETIIAIGATPVIVDVDETYNMDPIELEKAITSKTKLIVPVHMLGNTAAMDEIMAIANKHQIAVLEDSCEALGASYKGQFAGTIGHAGIYSLDFGKTITTGEGGMIVTNDENIYKFCKEYHDHGHESNPAFPRGRDTRTMAGMNYRMNEMQGAVGMAQLEKLETIVNANRMNKTHLINNINSEKIKYRVLTDADGDLSDTIIFNFKSQAEALKFVDLYKQAGYGTKNIPDAIDWHFAGTWNHMFNEVPAYKNSWKTEWQKSAELLYRSVALPINVKTTSEDLAKHVDAINKILEQI